MTNFDVWLWLADFKPGSEIDMSDIQKNLQNLYEYNVMLREKLLAVYSSRSGDEGAASEKDGAQGRKPSGYPCEGK